MQEDKILGETADSTNDCAESNIEESHDKCVDSNDTLESNAKSQEESCDSSDFASESDKVDESDSSEENCCDNPAESSKIKELEEKYIRAYAEFENIKKRLEREKYQSLEYANEQILKDFLPILDTLESALNSIVESENSDDSINNIKKGIELTIENFIKAFSKHNVEVIDNNGEFDPNVHNAIMQVNCEGKKDGEIAQVIQKGYKYKDRVIRPSMIAITKN